MHRSPLWFALLISGSLRAAVWQLPLPQGTTYVPLSSMGDWTVPGAFATAEAATTGLRNTAPRDVLAGHAVAGGGLLRRNDGTLRIALDVSGRTNTAVWVGIGADTVETNGVLDGIECRLMVGFDRSRWGLRQGAMGETVWTSASLSTTAKACQIEIVLNPATGQLLSATVWDQLGRRNPTAFAAFNPDWSGQPAGAGSNWWQLVRIETRGTNAELRGLQVGYAAPSALIIR